jgi:hypothetical protein
LLEGSADPLGTRVPRHGGIRCRLWNLEAEHGGEVIADLLQLVHQPAEQTGKRDEELRHSVVGSPT